jgi:hypothetical protein
VNKVNVHHFPLPGLNKKFKAIYSWLKIFLKIDVYFKLLDRFNIDLTSSVNAPSKGNR